MSCAWSPLITKRTESFVSGISLHWLYKACCSKSLKNGTVPNSFLSLTLLGYIIKADGPCMLRTAMFLTYMDKTVSLNSPWSSENSQTLYFSLLLPLSFTQRGHQWRLPLFKCTIKMREKQPRQSGLISFLEFSQTWTWSDVADTDSGRSNAQLRPRSRSHPCWDRHWGLPLQSTVGKTHLMCTCPELWLARVTVTPPRSLDND